MNRPFVVFLLLLTIAEAHAGLSVPFSYQGKLNEAGAPANGNYDFLFQVFDQASGGNSSAMVFTDNVSVVDGVFTTELDFNSNLESFNQLYLEIGVRPAGGGNYTPLSPRQPMHGSPRSYFALDVQDGSVDSDALANSAVNATNVNSSQVQLRVNGVCTSGNAIRTIQSNGAVTCEPVTGGGGNGWELSGNAGTTEGSDFVGTSDDVALDVRTNNQRAMRYEWGFASAGGPNLIGGHGNNNIPDSNESSVIAGGGLAAAPNSISANYGFIGGGIDNQVSAPWGSIPGGSGNRVAGNYSFAAGRTAQANHNNTFVWSDGGNFASTADDQFLIDAAGGVGIGVNNPSDFLHINAPATANAMRVQVDGATRLRVFNNGGVSVGVNGTPPAAGLLVQGELRTNTPVTRWLALSPSDFVSVNGNFQAFSRLNLLEFSASSTVGTFVEMGAPVHLPHGAVITSLEARVLDSQSSGNINLYLRRYAFDQPSELMADFGTTGSMADEQTIVDNSIDFATIDNATYHYQLEVDTENSGATGRHYVRAVRITYTTPNAIH